MSLALAGCPNDPEPENLDPTPAWRLVFEKMPSALLRVWGTNAHDVYVVGADADGEGPVLLHYDGDHWRKLDTGLSGDLWWIDGVGSDDVRMVGEAGMVVSYHPSTDTFVRRDAPTRSVLFGVWGSSPEDSWYVGGDTGPGHGVVWRDDGTTIQAPGAPLAATSSAVIFKVAGFSPNAIWMVGQRGRTVFWNGSSFVERIAPVMLPLFAVSGVRPDRVFAVGGASSGVLLAFDGTSWTNEAPRGTPAMNGVWALSDEEAYAAGFNGRIFHRTAAGWAEVPDKIPTFKDFHALWIDPEGGIWAVGGQLSSDPPTEGVLVHYGPEISKRIE